MSTDIVRAYRHVYRQALRAIQFSKPARFTLQQRLRLAFRKGNAADFDQKKIDNTLEFLRGATRDTGLEHKVLKNILLVWYHQQNSRRQLRLKSVPEFEARTTSYDAFNHSIRMLNESMEMCLPIINLRPDLY